MGMINYDENHAKFSELPVKPLPLINKAGFKIVNITKELVMECTCPISRNVISILEEGKVSCDVGEKGRLNCGSTGLEDRICPYSDKINKKL